MSPSPRPRPRPTPPPLLRAVLAALWLASCRGAGSEAPGPGCDNGKLRVHRDLPEDVHGDCPAWTPAARKHPATNRVYDPEPARQVCMDTSIVYKHAIPSSGAYRPVMAENGEYVYCPPQRWLNNLHHAATVLLHHPCAPPRERAFLSVLARSCLQRYVLTSHPQLRQHTPVALVSWGRTLELSTAASPDVCGWLETTTPAGETPAATGGSRKYNLLLTRSAEQRGRRPGDVGVRPRESAGQCCQRIVSSFLVREEEDLRQRRRRRRREIRGAPAEHQSHVHAQSSAQNHGHTLTSARPDGADSQDLPSRTAAPSTENGPQRHQDGEPEHRRTRGQGDAPHRRRGPGSEAPESEGAGFHHHGDPVAPAGGPLLRKGSPRTEEAVWAAAALGSLLVLLALAVLHTRLYRHWRSAPSLYWYDPRRDYESVADVIRRRLRIAKRRRRRSRGQPCVLLPDSSSSDGN